MPKTRSYVQIEVPPLGGVSYPIDIGHGTITRLGEVSRDVLGEGPRRAFLIADSNLSATTVASATLSLEAASFEVTTAELVAEEPRKSMHTALDLLTTLSDTGAERTEPVIALGGGITGDVAGFVASAYRRGVPFIQCPTTLLAMVDASVGGKAGVNLETSHGLLKNAAGAFHQPRAVLADVATLGTLPDRELRAGLAECLKHGLLSAGFHVEDNLFPWTTSHVEHFLVRDRGMLIELVTRNVRVKAAVVKHDPLEISRQPHKTRQLLNLGHTFAHAIETIPGLAEADDLGRTTLLHGEAVALGLVAAAAAGEHLQTITESQSQQIRAAVASLNLPTRLRDLPPNEVLLDRMMLDKKVQNGRLSLILPTTSLIPASDASPLGMATVVVGPPSSAVNAGLDAIRA